MSKTFIDVRAPVNNIFEANKAIFDGRLKAVPNIESYFQLHIKRLHENAFGQGSIIDINQQRTFGGVFAMRLPFRRYYKMGWDYAENGSLDHVSKYSIEGWEGLFQTGAADALLYHWLQANIKNLSSAEQKNIRATKKPKLHSVALCYYYLNQTGEINTSIKDDIKEREQIAKKHGFSDRTLYKAYMEYVIDDEAMLKLEINLTTKKPNSLTVKAKKENLEGAIDLIDAIRKGTEAARLANKDLAKFNRKLDEKS